MVRKKVELIEKSIKNKVLIKKLRGVFIVLIGFKEYGRESEFFLRLIEVNIE